MKRRIWKLEYSITIYFLLGLVLLLVPLHIENYWQARMITRWNDKFEKISYMFSVINAQKNDEILKSFAQADSTELREKMLYQIIKPYLRISPPNKYPRRYKPRFVNGSRVPKNSEFYFPEIYFSEKKMTIVGLKDLTDTKTEDSAWFMMMVDTNGLLPPNTWGRDIFGLYIFDEGHIEPFGHDYPIEKLMADCSEKGLGFGCSYYYLIGGEYND